MDTVSFVQLKQVVAELQFEDLRLSSASNVANFAQEYFGNNDRETLVVIGVSTKSAINFISTFSIGSLNATIATPCGTFKTAIIINTARIFFSHNHPSYDITPSEAGDLLGIELIDRLIVSLTAYFSFLSEGLLEERSMSCGIRT